MLWATWIVSFNGDIDVFSSSCKYMQIGWKQQQTLRQLLYIMYTLNDCWYRRTCIKHHYFSHFSAFVCLWVCMYVKARIKLPNDIVKEFFVCNTSPWWTEWKTCLRSQIFIAYTWRIILMPLSGWKSVVWHEKLFPFFQYYTQFDRKLESWRIFRSNQHMSFEKESESFCSLFWWGKHGEI